MSEATIFTDLSMLGDGSKPNRLRSASGFLQKRVILKPSVLNQNTILFIPVVDAPGVGFALDPLFGVATLKFGTTPYSSPHGGVAMQISQVGFYGIETHNGLLPTSVVDAIQQFTTAAQVRPLTQIENQPLHFFIGGASAAPSLQGGDGTLIIDVTYKIVPVK